jgi:N-ethylmaleimide reductase
MQGQGKKTSAEPVDHSKDSELFRPIAFGNLLLKNRIVMSPMTRQRSPGGIPNELNLEYYAMRADAGLIIGESTYVSPTGVSRPGNIGLFSPAQVEGWSKITAAVHAGGGRIFAQLMHSGHNSHRSLQPDGRLPMGPCAIRPRGTVRTAEGYIPLETPRAIETSEMPVIVEEYRRTALRARDAGFDGIEVHGGNGYLLDQFLRDCTNKRTDAYGGSVQNRQRLLLEVVEAVLGVWDRSCVGVRISPTNPAGYDMWDSDPQALFFSVAENLKKLGIGFLDVVEGVFGQEAEQQQFDFDELRSIFGSLYIANNRYSFESGNAAIRSGHADLIAFGRPFVANPDLVPRFRFDLPLNQVNEATIRSAGRVGYLDYPTLDGTFTRTVVPDGDYAAATLGS